jgi:hypothetical protein
MAHSNLVEEAAVMDYAWLVTYNLKMEFYRKGKPTYDGLQAAFCVKS